MRWSADSYEVSNLALLSGESGGLDAERWRTLYRVGKLVTASVDLKSTLGGIVDAAQQLTGAVSTAILLVDDEGQLVVAAGRGPIASAVGERVPGSSGVVGLALAEGRTCLVQDMSVEPSRARPDLDVQTGLRSFIAAPLIWKGERLGALTIGTQEPGELDSTKAELLSELAEQAAAAVTHARAYAQEQARRAELEALNAALSRAQRRLIEREKQTALGQLSHGIAHELNTPLGVIISNLSVLGNYTAAVEQVAADAKAAIQRLRMGASPDLVATALEDALAAAELDFLLEDLPALAAESTESARRMASIVRSVAVFARASSDDLTDISIEEAVEAALTLSWNELKQRGGVVRDYSAAGRILGNSSELTQLFVHLLLNAAQALDGRLGRITIVIQDERETVAVRITDTGRGIAPEHLSRLFEPFFTTRAIGNGTGMGLAVCRGIVTRHGGTIDIDSEFGRGTSVTVRLPYASARSLAA